MKIAPSSIAGRQSPRGAGASAFSDHAGSPRGLAPPPLLGTRPLTRAWWQEPSTNWMTQQKEPLPEGHWEARLQNPAWKTPGKQRCLEQEPGTRNRLARLLLPLRLDQWTALSVLKFSPCLHDIPCHHESSPVPSTLAHLVRQSLKDANRKAPVRGFPFPFPVTTGVLSTTQIRATLSCLLCEGSTLRPSAPPHA